MRGAAIGALVLAGCAGPLPEANLVRMTEAPPVFPLPEAPPAPVRTATAGLDALSLEGAIVLALTNNRDLQVQAMGPIVAGAFERIERGVFDPELFADFVYFQENASQVARATGERFDVFGRRTDAAVGVRQRLPTGTTVEAAVVHRMDESDRTPEQQEARLDLTVTQSLLQGFGPAVNLVRIRQAALEVEASVFELRAFTEVLLAETEIAYWRYVLAAGEIAIFERALGVAEQEAAEVRQRIEVGLLPEIEAAAVEAEIALRRQALIDARSRLEEARLLLLRRLSPAERLDLDVVAVSPARIDPAPLEDVGARVRLAVERRPELGEARLRLRQERLETVLTRNGVLPRLDAFVALGKTGFAGDFPGAFTGLDNPTYDVRAGLSLGYFVGNRAARGLDVQARATARRARLAVENLAEQVRLEVRLAANEVERARAQIEATAATTVLQEAAVRAERERFEVGSGTALLVARAQRDLLESEIAEIRAVVDYRAALVRLYLAEGTLLARRGITVVGTEG